MERLEALHISIHAPRVGSDIIFAYQGQHYLQKGGYFRMPAQWTGEVLGEMHLNDISAQELAEKIGIHPKYLSAIMNGHREPKGAEEKVRTALDELIQEKRT